MFELDLRSRKSIYEQVIDNLKEMIMTDELPFETKLPSVRDLSKQISVNPNTVQKAYRELERQGYIYTQTGLGTFVADKASIVADTSAVNKAEQGISDAFKQLLFLGMDFDKAKKRALEIIESIRKEGVIK